MLDKEQIVEVKKQLLQQISSTFPEDKKESAIKQVESMDGEQLEQFLVQNNLIRSEGQAPQGEQKCIFCSIIFGETPSYKLDENKSAIAILEINPASKGHVLIIPKEHITSGDKLPAQAFSLSRKIARKLKSKLKPQEVSINSTNIMGHEIVNVIPIYEGQPPTQERKKADEAELQELQKLLQVKPRKPRAPSSRVKKSPAPKKSSPKKEKLWLPVRIP